MRSPRSPRFSRPSRRFPEEPKEFEEKIVKINRVSKKTKGGNRISFSALVVVGNRKGRVGVGLGKGPDVASAIRKGITYAKNHLITVPIKKGTIPHRLVQKFKAAKILFKPSPPGSGLIAGRPVRVVADAAGIHDLSSKILGSRNLINNVYCTIEALKNFKRNLSGDEKQETPRSQPKTSQPTGNS